MWLTDLWNCVVHLQQNGRWALCVPSCCLLFILCQHVAGGGSHFPGRWQVCMWILSGWEAKLIQCFLCNCYNPLAVIKKGSCPVNIFHKKSVNPASLLNGMVLSFHCRWKREQVTDLKETEALSGRHTSSTSEYVSLMYICLFYWLWAGLWTAYRILGSMWSICFHGSVQEGQETNWDFRVFTLNFGLRIVKCCGAWYLKLPIFFNWALSSSSGYKTQCLKHWYFRESRQR